MSINQVAISGNLTHDARRSNTKGGTAVLTFSVAVNDRRKNQATGEWEDYPNYIDCVLFGRLAESLEQYMTKGTKVSVGGKLRWTQWEHDGQKRSKVEVIADDVEIMRAAQPQAQAPAPTSAPAQPAPAPVQPMTGVVTDPVAVQPTFVQPASIYDEESLPF